MQPASIARFEVLQYGMCHMLCATQVALCRLGHCLFLLGLHSVQHLKNLPLIAAEAALASTFSLQASPAGLVMPGQVIVPK